VVYSSGFEESGCPAGFRADVVDWSCDPSVLRWQKPSQCEARVKGGEERSCSIVPRSRIGCKVGSHCQSEV